MTLTRNFMNYIKEFDIKSSSRMPIKDIKDDDAVYPGLKIFEFFFDGSKYTAYDGYRGPDDFVGLQPKNFGHWHYIFEKCMADMTTRTGEGGL